MCYNPIKAAVIMKEKRKGYIAPIVITIVLLLYFAVYFGVLIALLSGIWRFFLLIFPVAFAGVLIYVCIDRIKEIWNGEEDELSQY